MFSSINLIINDVTCYNIWVGLMKEIEEIREQLDKIDLELKIRARTIRYILDVLNDDNLVSLEKCRKIEEIIDEYLEVI